jgi:PPE-repeat protein
MVNILDTTYFMDSHKFKVSFTFINSILKDHALKGLLHKSVQSASFICDIGLLSNFGCFNIGFGNVGFFQAGIGNSGLINAGVFNGGLLNAGALNVGAVQSGRRQRGFLNKGVVPRFGILNVLAIPLPA